MARRVFFSFHYQDVIDFRANVVRKHNITKDDNGGFFDASIWESSKKQGDLALKRLINGGLDNTSVTAVLIGSQTYARRWVRYEIMKSIEYGNSLLGIHINSIGDKHGGSKPLGPNPFNNLGLAISSDGLIGTPTEWDGTKFVVFKDLEKFKIPRQPTNICGKHFRLTKWFPVYDWIADNGYENFGEWVK